MKLYLVRHAESERNLGKQHDKLSETGVEQAKRLGLFLKGKHIDFVYCSKLARAIETLNHILPNLKKLNVTYTENINEQDLGVYKQRPIKEYNYHLAELKDQGVDLLMYKPDGGGENLLETEKRAQEFLDYLNKNHKSKDHILIVSHGNFLKTFILRLLKLDIKEFRYFTIHNASLSDFELDNNFNVKNYEIDEFKHLLMFSSFKRKTVEKV